MASWKDLPPTPLVREALLELGVKEAPGPADNPRILAWARELGLGSQFEHDEQAWCTLFVSAMVNRAGLPLPPRCLILWSQAYAKWGSPREGEPQFGDVVVTWRKDPLGKLADGQLGHVRIFLEKAHDGLWTCLAGNVSDQVMVSDSFIGSHNLVAVRIPPEPMRPQDAIAVLAA